LTYEVGDVFLAGLPAGYSLVMVTPSQQHNRISTKLAKQSLVIGAGLFSAVFVCHSPVKDTVVTNDRWGNNVRCRHGDFLTCDDRYNPGEFCD